MDAELRDLLRRAQHPILRRAYAALRSANPPTSWDALAALSPDQIRDRDLFPRGFLPLPHPNHAEGGMVFPHFEIDELKKQEARDLTRFDLDFDLPDHLLSV